jgi:hypothetical protein
VNPLEEFKVKVIPGVYRHYRDQKEYEVLGVGTHSETLEALVIYRALYTSREFGKNHIWARPAPAFLEEVEYNGSRTPRFIFIREC